MPMHKWEYLSVVIANGALVQFCNEKGEDGWEVCGLAQQGDSGTTMLMLKRRKS